MLDFTSFEALTFDCYGTLIDWEAGLRPYVASLEAFAAEEARLEAGPYLPYREILARAAPGTSVADWPAFPDSADALARLKERFRLGVLTNCDDDLFAASNAKLGVEFDWVVTAQQVGSYKPSERNFHALLERLQLPRERVLHVAQSLFHDHAPAKRLGFTTVWIDRRGGSAGGATPDAEAAPDAVYPDMASFAAAALRS